MFEAVRQNKRIAQVILGLISLTFVFWGVDSYLNDRGGASEVATVGETTISVYEFDQALRDQQDRVRAANQGNVDAGLLQSPLFRRAVLDNLINQRLLALYALENRLSVSDQQLRDTIGGAEAFQDGGQFSMARYQSVLRSRGLNELQFQERVRGDLTTQQVLSAVGEAAVVPAPVAIRLLAAQLESRTVHMVEFKPDDFVDTVALDDAAVKAYYDANAAQFTLPARVKASYVVLSAAQLRDGVSVDEAQIQAEYEQNKANYGTAEERKASHILLQLANDASEPEVAAARQKAEALLAEVLADPSQFGAVAKRASDDPGSADRDGDLGFFARGAMVKAFEDAVFAAEPGVLPQVVRSEFGFHVIRLDEVRGGTIPALADLHDKIKSELLDKAASRRFLEVAEQFANIVYEQPDSLAPVAKEFGLTIKTTDDWLAADASGLPGIESAAIVKSLFSEDVLQNKHNTDAIDVGENTMVAARVAEHEPARQRAFDEIRAEVEQAVRRQRAAEAASQQGAAQLAELVAGKSPQLAWGEPITLQRGLAMLPPAAMAQVFALPDAPLPAYAGVALDGAGYALFRLDAVNKTEIKSDDARVKGIAQQYAQLLGGQDMRAFLDALRERYTVKINPTALAVEPS
ncbi:MAG: SurA N-terminal domain-containing protein [Rhodocyclaceae bacterium]|nr:SurA N-terminal domain-containing protein [Rhodocyclaceae bacterium]